MGAGALPRLVALLRHSDADSVDGKATISAAEALRNFADGATSRTGVRYSPFFSIIVPCPALAVTMLSSREIDSGH